jgi:hypothetical protein
VALDVCSSIATLVMPKRFFVYNSSSCSLGIILVRFSSLHLLVHVPASCWLCASRERSIVMVTIHYLYGQGEERKYVVLGRRVRISSSAAPRGHNQAVLVSLDRARLNWKTDVRTGFKKKL